MGPSFRTYRAGSRGNDFGSFIQGVQEGNGMWGSPSFLLGNGQGRPISHRSPGTLIDV